VSPHAAPVRGVWVFAGSVISVYVLPLLGPEYVRVTDPAAGIVVWLPETVTGITLRTAFAVAAGAVAPVAVAR